MGGILSCLATEAACCGAKLMCSGLSTCFGSASSRVGYSLIFLLNASLSMLLLTNWASDQLSHISFGYLKLYCPEGSECHGILAVYRVCFALSLFHGILSLVMYNVTNTKDPRAKLQNGMWIIKLITWILLVAASFFIPNQFFIYFARFIDLPGAVLFILIQMVLLIDFVHTVSEGLLSLWEETGERVYIGLLIVLTFGSLAGAITLTGILYAWFGSRACQLNQFYISFNLILLVLCCILSIYPKIQDANPRSGLSQASVVALCRNY